MRLTALKQASELQSNSIAQVAMSEFCTAGYLQKHLKRMHVFYRARMKTAISAAKDIFSPETYEFTPPKGGYLFVFAQDADSNNRMPAAVVKQPLSSFPVEIVLDNTNAMLPNYTLAQLKNARLVARISVDDNVATSQGELQGAIVSPVSPDNVVSQHILIDKEL